jgi:hypothetical protein
MNNFMLKRVPLLVGFGFWGALLLGSQTHGWAAEPVEVSTEQIRIHNHLIASVTPHSSDGTVFIFEVSNTGEIPATIRSNISSLEEHMFLGFPRSAFIQVRDAEKRVLAPQQSASQGYWKPSASAASIPTDWEFIREVSLQPKEKVKAVIEPIEALEFASSTVVFGENSEWREVRIILEIVIEEDNQRKTVRLASPWVATE